MATYLALASVYLQPNPRLPLNNPFFGTTPGRVLLASIPCAFAFAVWWSRIRLGHHTIEQVIVGGSLGALFALVAFPLWQGSKSFGLLSGWRLPIIPASGLQQYGLLFERAVEDAAFVSLEAWASKNATTLVDTTVASFKQALRN